MNDLDRTRELVKLGYIALRRPRINRKKENVLKEYETGWNYYKDVLAKIDKLDDWLYLKGIEDKPLTCNVDGKIVYGTYNFPKVNREALVDSINEYFSGIKSITEYGCGIGRNLLYIKNRYPHIKCFGYELCSNGVKIANLAKEKFGIEVEYSQLDFINDREDKYIFPQTDCAFTMYALEQIPNKSDIAIKNILRHVSKGSIHIEPVVENYPLSIRGVIARIDHWKVDYLRGFERNISKINNIKFSKKELFTSHNPLMFPTVYTLEKV